MDSNTETLKGRLRRSREISQRVNLTVYVERFIDASVANMVMRPAIEDAVTHLTILLLMSREPIISIRSKHPLQRDGFYGLLWLEDGMMVGYVRSGKHEQDWVIPVDMPFDSEAYARVIAKIQFQGANYFSQYQHAVFDIMDKIQHKT